MEFTKNERLLLFNQYKILQKLHPEEADFYARAQRIVSDGYAFEYYTLAPMIEEDSALSVDECKEVRHVLDMFDQLLFSYEKLPDTSGLQKFSSLGFSGNEETRQMAYARFLVDDLGLWSRFKNHKGDMNSHVPMLNSYRPMIRAWRELERNYIDRSGFTKEEISRILQAGKLY